VLKHADTLKEVHSKFLPIAENYGFIMDAPTWRASPDYYEKLEMENENLNQIIYQCIQHQREMLANALKKPKHVLISAEIGPRGDGYSIESKMTISQAENYHSAQIMALVASKVDMATALTLNYADEAIGIALAAKRYHLPIIIGFTLEVDGRLPDGSTIEDFIKSVDQATDQSPLCYILNCCHPTHCDNALRTYAHTPWFNRLRGIRANASTKSHAELDQLDHLDSGDPYDFASRLFALHTTYPNFRILGGCCGSNHIHLQAVADRLSLSSSS